MKTIRTISLYVTMLAASLMTLSCNKNESPSPDPTPGSKVDICITGNFNTFSTKAEIENIFMMKWSNGDTVYVYGTTNGTEMINLGSLTAAVVSGTDNCVADLSGSITEPQANTKLTLVYSPLLQSAPTPSDNAISIDLKSQGGKEDSVAFVAYTAVNYQGESSTYRASFGFATSVLRVNVGELTANTALTKATLGQIETACKLTFKSDTLPTVTGETADTITRTLSGCSANAKGNAAFYVAVPIITANADRKLTVVQGSGVTEYAGFATGAKDAGKMMNSIASLQLADLLTRIQSIEVVPDYQDGSVEIKEDTTVSLKFEVCPASLADSIVKKKGVSAFILQAVEAKAVTRASVFKDLSVTAVSFSEDDSLLVLTVSKGSLPTTFFDGLKPHNARLRISDGNTDKSSAYFPLTAFNPSYPEAPGLPSIRIQGIWWAPVNCGYDAGSYTYGKLYQWGRHDGGGYNDGSTYKEIIIQTNADGPVSVSEEDSSKFYTNDNTSPYDWLSTRINTRWNSGSAASPVKTSDDPCPSGWRVPTYDELNALIGNSGSTKISSVGWDSTNYGYWFNGTQSPKSGEGLFLPAAGNRVYNGNASQRDSGGFYWSSSVKGDYAWFLVFYSNVGPRMNDLYRAYGHSVRCVKE